MWNTKPKLPDDPATLHAVKVKVLRFVNVAESIKKDVEFSMSEEGEDVTVEHERTTRELLSVKKTGEYARNAQPYAEDMVQFLNTSMLPLETIIGASQVMRKA